MQPKLLSKWLNLPLYAAFAATKTTMTSDNLLTILENSNLFLSGGAGVGKSYLTLEVIKKIQAKDKNVIPLGSTGISAVNIGGYTLHSFFIFGLAKNLQELKSQDSKNRSRINELKKVLQATDLIIIDEISMVSAKLMDMIYYRLFSLGYGGKLMVVGDFYQLPPVIKQNSENSLFKEEVYAFESSAWEKFGFTSVILQEVKRTSDLEFINILSKIRVGVCDLEVKEYLNSLMHKKLPPEIEPTYLFGRNAEANDMNREKLSKLNGQEAIYFADTIKHKRVHEKRLESWFNSLPILNALHIKVGAPVIFTVNQWGKFVNGQRGVVVELGEDYITVRSKGRNITVTQADFDMLVLNSETLEAGSVATVSQYPIKLAYAITIHKSQGMSLESLVCNLNNLFAPSQLYVAISRAVEPKLLKIEYDRYDFNSYLNRVIAKNEIVDEFYKGLKNEN